MSSPAVTQSLAFCSSAVEAVALAKRAALETARSWSQIAASQFPGDRPGPWTLVDAGFASAESFVTAQNNFARSVFDATAVALGVSSTKSAPGRTHLPTVEVVPASVPVAPKPAAKVAPAAAPVSHTPTPKPAATPTAAPVRSTAAAAKVATAAAPASRPQQPAAKVEPAAAAGPSSPKPPAKETTKAKGPKASGGTRKRA